MHMLSAEWETMWETMPAAERWLRLEHLRTPEDVHSGGERVQEDLAPNSQFLQVFPGQWEPMWPQRAKQRLSGRPQTGSLQFGE